jgi:hypothetical protein
MASATVDQYTTQQPAKPYPQMTPQQTGNTPPNQPAPNRGSPGAPTGYTPGGGQWGGSPNGGGSPSAPSSPAPWQPKALLDPAPTPSTPETPAPLYGADMEGKINNWLTGIMGGEGQTFNPKLMGTLRGQLFNAAQGQANSGIASAEKDALSKGMFRSGLPEDAILQAKANAGQNFTKAEGDLESQAAQANSSQKMSALSALENALQGNRDFYLKDYQAKKPTPGPDYNQELLGLMGGMGAPEF